MAKHGRKSTPQGNTPKPAKKKAKKKPLPEPPSKDEADSEELDMDDLLSEIEEEEEEENRPLVPPELPPETDPAEEEEEANPKPRRAVSGLSVPQSASASEGVQVAKPTAPPPASKQVVIRDEFDHDVAFKFSFLGTGQGGGRLADAFYQLGYRRVGVFNTAEADFRGLTEEIPKLHLGVGGARKDPGLALKHLRGREEEVRDLLLQCWGADTEYGMVCAGLGGGTGSGTVVPLVRLAREYMQETGKEPKVGAVVSLPSIDEGGAVCRNAVNALDKLLAEGASPVIIVDNERVHQIHGPSMRELNRVANSFVSQLLNVFNQLAAVHSEYMTFDRSEFGQLLDGGISVFGYGQVPEVNSPADISKAIKQHLSGSVLAEVDLQQAGLAACLYVASDHILSAYSKDYFAAGFNTMERMLRGGQGLLHRGVFLGADEGLECYTMLSMLPPPKARLQQLARRGGVREVKGGLADFLNVE